MQNFFQLRMQDAQFLAANRSHAFDSGATECVADGVSTDHSSRAHNDETLLADGGNTHRRAGTHFIRRGHNRMRSSIQSTYSLRSANSHAPSCFTKVSLGRSAASGGFRFAPPAVRGWVT